MSTEIHVVRKGNRWLVTRGNYTLCECDSQNQAVTLGKQRAQSDKTDLIVHAEDGSVQSVMQHRLSGGRHQHLNVSSRA